MARLAAATVKHGQGVLLTSEPPGRSATSIRLPASPPSESIASLGIICTSKEYHVEAEGIKYKAKV